MQIVSFFYFFSCQINALYRFAKSAHCNKMAQHANKSIDRTLGGAEGEEVK